MKNNSKSRKRPVQREEESHSHGRKYITSTPNTTDSTSKPFTISSTPSKHHTDTTVSTNGKKRKPELLTAIESHAPIKGDAFAVLQGARYRFRPWWITTMVERRAPIYIVLVAMLTASMMILWMTYDDVLTRNMLRKRPQIALDASRVVIQVSYACHKALVGQTKVAIPASIDNLQLSIQNYDEEQSLTLMLMKSKALLEKDECALAVTLLHQVFTILTVDAVDHLTELGYADEASLPFSWSIAMTSMAHYLHVYEANSTTNVDTYDALRTIGYNLVCLEPMSYFGSKYQPGLDNLLVCDNATNMNLLERMHTNRPHPMTNDLVSLVLSYLSDENNRFLSFTQTEATVLMVASLPIAGIVFVLSLSSMGILGYWARKRLRATALQRTLEKDFCSFDRSHRTVTVRRHMLQLLDYYCWRIGGFEKVEPSIARAIQEFYYSIDRLPQQQRQQPPQPQPQQEGASTVPLSPSVTLIGLQQPAPQDPPLVDMVDTMFEKSLLTNENSKTPHMLPIGPMIYKVPKSLVEQRASRYELLKTANAEYHKLTGASQMQLLLHQTVHPIQLLRPFLPSWIRRHKTLTHKESAGLGDFARNMTTGIVMKDGLEEDMAVFLFVSFRHFNTQEAINSALEHFTRRSEACRELLHEVRCDRRHKQSRLHSLLCLHHGYIKSLKSIEKSLAAELNFVMDECAASSMIHVGGRLAEAWEQRLAEAVPHLYEASSIGSSGEPLSILSVCMNFLLDVIRDAASTFGGDVAQIGSDGALIQFRTIADTLDDDEDVGLSPAQQHDDTARLRSHYDKLPEERAARAAVFIQDTMDHYADSSNAPRQLLSCPMSIVSETECLRGSVRFHVSKHYCVLSKCMPLLLALESVAHEHRTRIVISSAVYNRIKDISICRPIHLLELDNLHLYVHDFADASAYDGTDATDTTAESNLLCSPRPIDTTFELCRISPLQTSSDAYRLFHDEDVSTAARRQTWMLIWNAYEKIATDRYAVRALRHYKKQREKEHADYLIDENFSAIRPSLLVPAGGIYVPAATSSVPSTPQQSSSRLASSSGTGDDPFAVRNKRRSTSTALATEMDVLARLNLCASDIRSFQEVYGVRPWEEYAVCKVLDDVTSMIDALEKAL